MRFFYLSWLLSVPAIFFSCNQKSTAPVSSVSSFPVVEVPIKTIVGYNTYPAVIEGTNNNAVRPKIGGYISKVWVDEGQAVKQGQVLFSLETNALGQEAEAAKANVNAAQVEVDKLIPLVEKNIISPVQLETAKARLAQAQSVYNGITANIGYATVRSPIDGHVGSINFREGALVSPSDPSPLTTVSTTDEVFVFFSLNEKEYLDFLNATPGATREEKIKNFPKVELQLINGEIYQEQGVIETITGQVNRSTGTVSFRAKFPNSLGLLANGSSGVVRIPEVYENVLVVPESATFERQGKVYAYQVQGDSLAVNIPITLIARISPYAIVGSGLKEGDRIVAQGTSKLRGETPIIPEIHPFDSIVKPIVPTFK